MADRSVMFKNNRTVLDKLLELDSKVKICFITAGEANMEVLRELYPSRDLGCFIKKPVTIDQLVRRVKAELE